MIDYSQFEEQDPPIEINSYGDKIWKNSEGQLHRDDDLPTIIYNDGSKCWYQNGKSHRLEGPAIIYLFEDKLFQRYYIYGLPCESQENLNNKLELINKNIYPYFRFI